ncbi:MAG TPA: diguanylate cyclase [Vicinamibacterales bacterium]|nr:diguanylate cyclase [Vicinamibacterales bacterium]
MALNPHLLAGSTALVVALLLLVVYFYRRRLFIVWGMSAWMLLAGSMLIVSRSYGGRQLDGLAYGLSQFIGLLSSLAFVVAADAYRQRPRVRRGYGLVLLAVAIFLIFFPVASDSDGVRAVGHVLIAGGMGTAAVAHFLLLRRVKLLGASIIGVALLGIAGLNVLIGAVGSSPESPAMTPALLGMTVFFLIAGLGQQLMAFEDMTYELQRTNRRLEKAQQELRELVITDALTGTRNRRFFDEVIGRELQRHRRYRTPLSIVFVDVDRFKAINDTLGHEIGDRVLREVAGFLLKNFRGADYVFRWGGDEFLILISCREAEAVQRAAELQRAFAASATVADLPAGVGLSIGCVEVPNDTTDILPLVQSADERMYVDKKDRSKRSAG